LSLLDEMEIPNLPEVLSVLYSVREEKQEV
jgi:hypothetical protein